MARKSKTEEHYFANDGSDWTSSPSPLNSTEAREADSKVDEQVAKGDGPTATNDVKLSHTIVEGSESTNG